jgi:hypothetical protein
MREVIEYMSAADFAHFHNLDPGTIRRYKHEDRLPEADAVIGIDPDGRKHYGWLLETVENWRTDLKGKS